LGGLIPPENSITAALRRAVQRVFVDGHSHRHIDSMGGAAYMVRENLRTTSDEGTKSLEYRQAFSVEFGELSPGAGNSLIFRDGETGKLLQIGDQSYAHRQQDDFDARMVFASEIYNKEIGYVAHHTMSRALVRVVNHLHGIALKKETGSFYWLPDDALATWKKVCDVFEDAGPGNRTSRLLTSLDAAGVASVIQSLTAEIKGDVAQLDEQLSSGTLGDKTRESTWTKRVEEIQAKQEKLQEYERTLGENLDELKGLCSAMENQLVFASLASLTD